MLYPVVCTVSVYLTMCAVYSSHVFMFLYLSGMIHAGEWFWSSESVGKGEKGMMGEWRDGKRRKSNVRGGMGGKGMWEEEWGEEELAEVEWESERWSVKWRGMGEEE